MNKKLFSLLLLFLTIFSFHVVRAEELINEEKEEEVTVAETVTDTKIETTGVSSKYKLIIEDDAHLLSSDEIEKLADKMLPLAKYGHIAFKSIESNTTTTAAYAKNYYRDNFGYDSGTVFLIDMDNREIYIFSDGSNHKYVTDSRAYSITDNIYRYASRNEYYNCAYYAFDQIETLLEGGKVAEPMRNASNVFIALVVSFFINFLVVLGQSRIKKASNSEVVEGCTIDFKLGNVTAEKTGTHSVYSPVSDSSSSGGHSSGGHHSGGGGGHHSGGGGGHRF